MSTVTLTQGILNLPGSTLASKKVSETLLAKDFDLHHAFFNARGFHNHLSHHMLAAYDLGASAEQLKAIYEDNASYQRPIMLDGVEGMLKPGEIDEGNWKKHLGNEKAYEAYIYFFKNEAARLGSIDAVDKYVFSEEANEDDIGMLVRFVAGAIHPIIFMGYAAEYGNDHVLIAEALGQTAVHTLKEAGVEPFRYKPSTKKLPLLQVISELYSSKLLSKHSFKPDVFFTNRMNAVTINDKESADEIARICSMWDIPSTISAADLACITEETIWTTTLLLGGVAHPESGKPALDFFLMHALTSALFLPALTKNLVKPEHHVALYHHWLVAVSLVIKVQNTPTLKPDLLMNHSDHPLPPNYENVVPTPDKNAIVPNGPAREGINPWPLLIQSAIHAPDPHTPKALRTLLYGAIHYGTKGSGAFPGALDAEGNEVVPDIKHLDGSIFVRTAGVMLDTLGWVDWGQPKGDWARL